jgi:hypothetical protein
MPAVLSLLHNLFPYVSRSRIEEVGNGNPLEMMNASLLGLCQAG